MKIDAVGVVSKNINTTIEFYKKLGFKFPVLKGDESHIEAINEDKEIRLMIDTFDLIKEIIGENPIPSNHSVFAIKFETTTKLDDVVHNLKSQGYTIVKVPWDAFWGQRYALVQDPDGYKIDLFADLD